MSGFLGGGGSGGGGSLDGYAANGVFIYREGEPSPSGNVYSSWAAAYAARTAFKGSAVIEIDNRFGNGTVPIGTWDLSVTQLRGTKYSDPLYVVPVLSVYGQFTNFVYMEYLTIDIHSSGPLIIVPPSSHVTFEMWESNIRNFDGGLFDITDTILYMNVWNLSTLHVSAGGANIRLSGTSSVVLGVSTFSGIDPNAFSGTGDVFVYLDRSSTCSPTQPVSSFSAVLFDAVSEQVTVSYIGSQLPAAGVTRHTSVAGGAALNVNSGWTNTFPYRGLTIARGAGGPASVNYNVTFETPIGTQVVETIAVTPGGSAQTNNAGIVISVTTSVDPVGTTSFTTGDSFSLGAQVRAVKKLFADGAEVLFTFYADTSAIKATGISPNGSIQFSTIIQTLPVVTS